MTQSNEYPRCILALDLGTTTGWALRGYDGLITSGTVCFTGLAPACSAPQVPRLLQRLRAGGAALHRRRLPQLAVSDGQEPVAPTAECGSADAARRDHDPQSRICGHDA